VRHYLEQGISSRKISLGLPLYGRSFQSTDGMGKPYNGIGSGTFPDQPGVWLYRDLPKAGAREMWDDAAKAAYTYDAGKRELITFDTPRSVHYKSQYIHEKGLGGAFFWDASGDKHGSDDSLIAVMHQGLGFLAKKQNLLSYPTSMYANIRNGMPDA